MADKSEWVGSLLGFGMFSLFILYELGQALFLGRMDDFLFEEAEYVYFFERPIVFTLQCVGLAGFGYWLVRWALKAIRTGDPR